MPQVEVTYDIDANGILNVSARDKDTGAEQRSPSAESSTSTRARSSAWSPTPSEPGRRRPAPRRSRRPQRARRRRLPGRTPAGRARRPGRRPREGPGRELVADARQAVKEQAPMERLRSLTGELQQVFHALGQPAGPSGAGGGPPTGPAGAGATTTTSSTPTSRCREAMSDAELDRSRATRDGHGRPAAETAGRRRDAGRRGGRATGRGRAAAGARRPRQPAQALRPRGRPASGSGAGPGGGRVAADRGQPRAGARARSGGDCDGIAEGVRAVRDQALGVLTRLGFPRFDDVGEPFDPARHEAVERQSRADAPAGHGRGGRAAGVRVRTRRSCARPRSWSPHEAAG